MGLFQMFKVLMLIPSCCILPPTSLNPEKRMGDETSHRTKASHLPSPLLSPCPEGTNHTIMDSTLTHAPPSLNPIHPLFYCTNETVRQTIMLSSLPLPTYSSGPPLVSDAAPPLSTTLASSTASVLGPSPTIRKSLHEPHPIWFGLFQFPHYWNHSHT